MGLRLTKACDWDSKPKPIRRSTTGPISHRGPLCLPELIRMIMNCDNEDLQKLQRAVQAQEGTEINEFSPQWVIQDRPKRAGDDEYRQIFIDSAIESNELVIEETNDLSEYYERQMEFPAREGERRWELKDVQREQFLLEAAQYILYSMDPEKDSGYPRILSLLSGFHKAYVKEYVEGEGVQVEHLEVLE